MHGAEAAELVPGLLGGRHAEIVPEAAGELAEDPDVVARLARRVERLPDALDAALAARDRALSLAPARRCGEHDVRELARPREEDVLDDEVLELLQQPDGALLVRLGLRGVLAEHVTAEPRSAPSRRTCRSGGDPLRRDRRLPRRLEARAGLVVLDERESRQAVRQRAHVPAALDVVLAAQRVEPEP